MRIAGGIASGILTIAAIIALWSSFSLIGVGVLVLMTVGITVFGGVEVYRRVTIIQVDKEIALAGVRVNGPTYVVDRPADSRVKVEVLSGDSEQSVKRVQGKKSTDVQLLGGANGGRGATVPSIFELLNGYNPDSWPYTVAWQGMGTSSVIPVQSPDIRTTGIIGATGGGKTVTTFSLLTQIIIKTQGKVRFLVVDPHMNGGTGQALVDKLGPYRRFLLTLRDVRMTVPEDDLQYHSYLRATPSNPTEGGQDLMEWCKIIRAEVARRKQGKKGPTWVVIIDEFSAVMRGNDALKKATSDMLKDITQEARKFDIYAVVIGQDWRSSAVGDTDIRNTIPLWLCHQTNEQWSSAILPANLARLTPTLGTGEVVVLGTAGAYGKSVVQMVTEQERNYVADLFYNPEYIIEEVPNDETSQGDVHTLPTQQLTLTGPVVDVVVPAKETPLVAGGLDTMPEMDYDEYTCIIAAIELGLDHKEAASHVFGKLSPSEMVLKKRQVSEAVKWKMNH